MTKGSYGKDVIMQGAARVIGGILSFVSIFAFTYLFNEEIIGEYNLVLSTIQIITSITTLWLSQSVLRYYNNDKNLGSIILLTFFSALVSLPAYIIYVFLSDISFNIWAFLFVIITVFYNVFDALFRKRRKLIEYVGLEVFLAFGRIIPMIFIAIVYDDYNSVFFSQFIVMTIYFFVLLIKNKSAIIHTHYYFNKSEFFQYLRYGMPLVGLSISNWFLTTSDRYIIKLLGNNEEVGIYSTNHNLGNSIYMMFALILVNAMHPIIMNLWEKDSNEAMRTVSETLNHYLIFMSPLVFYGCLKGKILLSLFKGTSYATHSTIFVWTSLGIFIYGASLLYHKYYECIQQTQQILYMNIATAVFNIFMNFIMILLWGFEAAAFTTFLSYVLYVFIVRIRTHKVFKIRLNILNCIKISVCLILFYIFDYFFVHQESVLSFFVEGFIFVIYTILCYKIFKVFDFGNVINKILKNQNRDK